MPGLFVSLLILTLIIIIIVKTFKLILLCFLIMFVYLIIRSHFSSNKMPEKDVYYNGEKVKDVEVRVVDDLKEENKQRS